MLRQHAALDQRDYASLAKKLDAADAHVEALEAEKAALLEVLKESNAVCVCGCPNEQHENYGEDGEACEDDTHECNRASRAVLASVAKLRAEKAALQQENETLRKKYAEFVESTHDVTYLGYQRERDRRIFAEEQLSALLTQQGEKA